jgi:hypothetical protein
LKTSESVEENEKKKGMKLSSAVLVTAKEWLAVLHLCSVKELKFLWLLSPILIAFIIAVLPVRC